MDFDPESIAYQATGRKSYGIDLRKGLHAAEYVGMHRSLWR